MALTVGTVINHARDYHPALANANAPVAIAYRALSRFSDELTESIVRRVPGWMGQTETITLTSSVFEDGVDLTTLIPAGVKDFIDMRFLYDQSSPQSFVTGTFIPYEQRDMPHMIPAYTLLNNVLYLLGNDQVGQLAQAYQNYSAMVLSYTPIPADLTSNSSEFTGFLDDAREAFAAMLAAFWLRRLVSDPKYGVQRVDADYFDSVAEQEKARYLRRIWTTTQKQSYFIREVR